MVSEPIPKLQDQFDSKSGDLPVSTLSPFGDMTCAPSGGKNGHNCLTMAILYLYYIFKSMKDDRKW